MFIGSFTNTQMEWKKNIYNWHSYSSKYFSIGLNLEQVPIPPCASERWDVTHMPNKLRLVSLSPWGAGVTYKLMFVLCKALEWGERGGTAGLPQVVFKQLALPRGDKEKWISYSGTSSTSFSSITWALCLVKAHPCLECLVSVPCQFSPAKLTCWGFANAPARGASITLIFIYSETLRQYILALFPFRIIFSVIPHLSQKLLPAQGYILARG